MTTKSADQKHCFSCGAILHFSAPMCPHCGASQPKVDFMLQTTPSTVVNEVQTQVQEPIAPLPNHVYCRGCGKQIHEQAYACPKCGAPQRPVTTTIAFQSSAGGRSKVTAAIFAFLLGGLGAHRFYLGHIGFGLLYLCFFWTFIPAFVALIEGILYLTMSDEEFNRKYN